MVRKSRTVADRQKALQSGSPEAHFTLAGTRAMYSGAEGKELSCNISGYCRTRIFEFPGIDFHPNGDEPQHAIYSSQSVQASMASDLVGYFVNSMSSNHYAISPSLRYVVAETDEKVKSQQLGHVPVFLVIEESSQLTPVEMVRGECNTWDEMMEVDGERVPRLVGGREGGQFITGLGHH